LLYSESMMATSLSTGTYNENNNTNDRGMRQKRYDSVEKMLDLLDICKRIGPKFPLDAMFLDPHDRMLKLFVNSYS
jgi:hypothetical protein